MRCGVSSGDPMAFLRFTGEGLKDDIDRLGRRLFTLVDIADDAAPLMKYWERVMDDGNRNGVLNGLDKDGKPAPTLHYRPVGKPNKVTVAQRLGQNARLKRGRVAGRGKYESGVLPNNNLRTS